MPILNPLWKYPYAFISNETYRNDIKFLSTDGSNMMILFVLHMTVVVVVSLMIHENKSWNKDLSYGWLTHLVV